MTQCNTQHLVDLQLILEATVEVAPHLPAQARLLAPVAHGGQHGRRQDLCTQMHTARANTRTRTLEAVTCTQQALTHAHAHSRRSPTRCRSTEMSLQEAPPPVTVTVT